MGVKMHFVFVFVFLAVLQVSRCSTCKSNSVHFLKNNLKDVCIKELDSDKTLFCDSQCRTFKTLLTNWPGGKPKAAIVVLTHPKKLQRLESMLTNLTRFYLRRFGYPVIIFHERDYRPYIAKVKTFSDATLFFQEVEFKVPDFINQSAVNLNHCGQTLGYRHMCRFFSKTLSGQTILDGLEYIFRLDDDSRITHQINYDLFQFMKDNNKSYGYAIKHTDAYKCVYGLWNATARYIVEKATKPTFFTEWKEPWIFYNNFEISILKFWKSEEYQSYINYIDRLGGIYYYRWGDAPIKTLGLSLFMPKEQLHHFNDIGYSHGGLTNKPAD